MTQRVLELLDAGFKIRLDMYGVRAPGDDSPRGQRIPSFGPDPYRVSIRAFAFRPDGEQLVHFQPIGMAHGEEDFRAVMDDLMGAIDEKIADGRWGPDGETVQQARERVRDGLPDQAIHLDVTDPHNPTIDVRPPE